MQPKQISFIFKGEYPPASTAGLDEAGRGCWAGPVVAAAVILPDNYSLAGLNDSKKLSASAREKLALQIKSQAVAWGIGVVGSGRIDTINILNATFLAMVRAVIHMDMAPSALLIDGNRTFGDDLLASYWPWTDSLPAQRAIVKGDELIPAISAASILAKTFRDALMVRLAQRWPGYSFEKHKGYGTKVHLDALLRLGASPIHRMSFRPMCERREHLG